MNDEDKSYMSDLKRMHRRARIALVNSGPMGSWLLDTYGPREAKGRFALMGGVVCFVIMFFVGLHSGFDGGEVLVWCLLSSLGGGVLSGLLYPWNTYEQFLFGPLKKSAGDPRLAPLREIIAREDVTAFDKAGMVMDWTTIEINRVQYESKNPNLKQ